ncbi:isochorismatase family protein, partial [Vibrio cholerae]
MKPIHSMNKKFLTTRVLLTFSLILSSMQSWADVEALKNDILSRIDRGDKPVILMIDMQETTSKLPWLPAQAPGN